MNSVILAVIMLILLYGGYRLYGRLIERRVVRPDPEATVPAVDQRDGVDFEPASPIVLFGHHFSSIAGAGPIVGPIWAVLLFGWMAALGWIALGSIFIGAVHDYLALMVSARNRGRSLAQVAAAVISPRASGVFALFLWLALVLVIAVFGVLGAKTLIANPQMVIPTLGIIPIAMCFGADVSRGGLKVGIASVAAATALVVLIGIGYAFPVSLPAHWGDPLPIWFGILMIYCLGASLLPVWLLLQPRDYISTFSLFAGLSVGFLAVLFAHKALSAPAFVGLASTKGPIWPMLFVIVACGAVSGFHSVVASGTTVKQLPSEKDGLAIGYGSMILEGVLAVLAVIAVAAGLYWAGPHRQLAGQSLMADDILRSEIPNPIIAFSRGFGHLVSTAFGFVPFALAALLGAIMLKTFILTSLDTCTRLARFVVTETRPKAASPGTILILIGFIGATVWMLDAFRDPLGPRWGEGIVALILCLYVLVEGAAQSIALIKAGEPPSHQTWAARSRLLATVVTVAPAAYLGLTGKWQDIWPVFGASNQLIAALALMVVSVYLVGVRRPSLYAAVPAVFMLCTTVGALIWQACGFFTNRKGPQWVLGILSSLLAAMAVYVAAEALPRFRRLWTEYRAHANAVTLSAAKGLASDDPDSSPRSE
ncbi:MAG: carbon starvation protein A [Armatimonadota bacterium]